MKRKGKNRAAAFCKSAGTHLWKNTTWERGQRIAKGMSIGLTAVMVLVSVGLYEVPAAVDMETGVHTAQSASHSQVSAGNHSARIEMNSSKVSRKKDARKAGEDGKNVVLDNMVPNAAAGNVPNAVVENPAPLSLVEKAYENHGQGMEHESGLHRYQYPVEIGYAVDSNYDGKQAAGDYIFSKLYDTEDIAKQIEEEMEKDGAEENPEYGLDNVSGDGQEDEPESVSGDGKENASGDGKESASGDGKGNASKDGQKGEMQDLSEGSSEDGLKQSESASGEEPDRNDKPEGEKASGEGTNKIVENAENPIDQKELDFLKGVWNLIMPTQPTEVHITKKPKKKQAIDLGADTKVKKKVLNTTAVEEEESAVPDGKEDIGKAETEGQADNAETNAVMTDGETEDSQVDEREPEEGTDSDGTENDGQEDTTEKEENHADGSYFIVNGSMRAGEEIFVSDIVIKPTGINGFDRIRIGEEGEFGSSAILTKDAKEETVKLYFTDGTTVTDAVEYTYSKDTSAPALAFSEENVNKLQTADYTVYCTNQAEIALGAEDDKEGIAGTGVAKYNYLYGDKFKYIFDCLDDAKLMLPEAFYGRVLVNCADYAGNTSGIVSKHYLVENQAPEVFFSNGELCSAPYTLWVDIAETGPIVSGVQDIVCTVNGEPYDLGEMQVLEEATLGTDLVVPTQMTVPVSLEEEGTYTVEVRVKDYAGNETVQAQTIDVTKPEMVSVLMPKEFTIHIDPQQLAGREPIYSDDITLCNVSDFDVDVTVAGVTVNVEDGISDEGIKKDCKLYLVAPDTGKRIALKKGQNENVYSFCLPQGQDAAALYFVGDTAEGSDAMWRDSDISINVQLSFTKKAQEAEPQGEG